MSEEFNNWKAMAEALDKATGQIVRKAALDIQAQAQANAPVDTGNLKNSIYTKTSEGNNYPGKATEDLISDQVPETDEHTAYVAVGANYGFYVEYGTVHQPAHPYMTPAVEAVKPSFEAALGKIEEKLKEAGG